MDYSLSHRPSREASICLSVFEGLLDEKLGATRVEPKVVVVTNINPKLVGGTELAASLFTCKPYYVTYSLFISFFSRQPLPQ